MDAVLQPLERSALEPWFRAQRARWWPTMRWLAIALLCLAATDIAYTLARDLLLHAVNAGSGWAWQHERWLKSIVYAFWPLYKVQSVITWLECSGAIVLALSQAMAYHPTDEMRVAMSNSELQSTLRRQVVRTAYVWIFWLALLPGLVQWVTLLFMPYPVTPGTAHAYLLLLVVTLSTGLLAAELSIFATLGIHGQSAWAYAAVPLAIISALNFGYTPYAGLVFTYFPNLNRIPVPLEATLILLLPYLCAGTAAAILGYRNRRVDFAVTAS